jgi:hypothetical protein
MVWTVLPIEAVAAISEVFVHNFREVFAANGTEMCRALAGWASACHVVTFSHSLDIHTAHWAWFHAKRFHMFSIFLQSLLQIKWALLILSVGKCTLPTDFLVAGAALPFFKVIKIDGCTSVQAFDTGTKNQFFICLKLTLEHR